MEQIEIVGCDSRGPEVEIGGERVASVDIEVSYPPNDYLISIELVPRRDVPMTIPSCWDFRGAYCVTERGERFYPLGERFVEELLKEHEPRVDSLVDEYCKRLADQEDPLRRAA
jgi:hypothetical protein